MMTPLTVERSSSNGWAVGLAVLAGAVALPIIARGAYGGYGGFGGSFGGGYGASGIGAAALNSGVIAGEMSQLNQQNQTLATERRIGNLEAAIAVANTRTEDNYNFDRERSHLTNQLTRAEIREATCDFVPASKMLRPEQIGSPYHGGQSFLVSRSVAPYNTGGFCATSTYDNGCGCY